MRVTELNDGTVFLPKRKEETHKGNYGKLLILGGSVGYTGAPTLCARSAVRSGAGLVYLGVPAPIYEITAVKNDEAMPFPLPSDIDGKFSVDSADIAIERLKKCDVCAIGPGMGKGTGPGLLIRRVMESSDKPLVIDADGLNMLAGQMELLKNYSGTAVLTPHDGEFSRLGGVIEQSRSEAALRFAENYGCILVLKGHRTIIAFPEGDVYISTHGNPGMAKGGSGDVLTGVIAGLLCQLPIKDAITAAVYLHSYAGDICAEKKGEYSMTATDLIETLPEATQKAVCSSMFDVDVKDML